MAAQPVERPGLRRRRGDDEERVLGEPRDRGVELHAAARVEHGRVDDAARRPVEVRGEDALDRRRARPGPPRGAWRTTRGRTARRPRARRGARRRPRRTSSGGRRSTRTPAARPGGAYHMARSQPAASPKQAPAAARRSYSGTSRRPRAVPGCRIRPVHRVQPAQRLAGALEEVARAGLGRREAAHVEVGRVHRRRAGVDPLRERAAGAGAEDDALRVHAGGDEEPGDLGGLAEQEVAVRA